MKVWSKGTAKPEYSLQGPEGFSWNYTPLPSPTKYAHPAQAMRPHLWHPCVFLALTSLCLLGFDLIVTWAAWMPACGILRPRSEGQGFLPPLWSKQKKYILPLHKLGYFYQIVFGAKERGIGPTGRETWKISPNKDYLLSLFLCCHYPGCHDPHAPRAALGSRPQRTACQPFSDS